MKVQVLLDHHGIAENPFAEEDAQTDPVFKEHCIASTYHPTWDKVYGDPSEPSTSIVFGEKGAGKTAMRLQIARHLAEHNRANADRRIYVIEYDDFNPFLDRFRDRLSRRRQRADRALAQWRLWDHMDAILVLGVTRLVDEILSVAEDPNASEAAPSGDANRRADRIDPQRLDRLDRHQRRDLLLLAACYDQSLSEPLLSRWHHLRRKLGFWTLKAKWDVALGIATTVGAVALLLALAVKGRTDWLGWGTLYWLLAAGLAAGWGAWLWHAWTRCFLAVGVSRRTRVCNQQLRSLRRILMNFTNAELAGQPLPNKDRTDDRYELLGKLQGVLKTLGFHGITVLVDRIDEPHLINGSDELMRDLLWPMLDNKFLKQSGLGMKLLVPIEISRFVQREDHDFYQRARLDKQNMIPSLEWTGEALYDVANARIAACASPGATPTLRDLFDDSISDGRLVDSLRSLRVPRHLFKFMYRVLVAHCNAHTDQQPVWKIPVSTFESVLAVYSREQDAFDRGLGAG